MPRPRIAIPVPTSVDEAYNQRSWPNYAAAVEAAGAEAVKVDVKSATRALRDAARTCSGILLPGSPADVLPSRYGADADPATNKADEYREATDWTLLEEAERNHLPVLGICYGLQSLNVYRGGSLVQDLMPVPVNHSAGSKVAIAHTAEIAKESLLGSLLTSGEAPMKDGLLRLPVNSSHHQAIAQPGTGMRIVARCPEDGVIEAIEADYDPNDPKGPWFFMAVQWHPERSTEISAASRALFSRLVAEAERHAAVAASR
ncbi:MAG TPA: gamma-glutamyl-gamma-aminobutyrate hydrolase family protein [Candidatus Aquilonibacter sp.]|nr:gamma-glutamyl-gamma-aminobutyrate hydrolase family protein [Candidatus Aquilonibacter sp.]